NQDGHYPGSPDLRRTYNAFELTWEKRMSNQWQMLGSYRYAKLRGNYEGLFNRDYGQSDPNISAAADFGVSPAYADTYKDGALPNDIAHMFKVFGSYAWKNGLNTGVGFTLTTGNPISALGPAPAYGEGLRVIGSRGDQ